MLVQTCVNLATSHSICAERYKIVISEFYGVLSKLFREQPDEVQWILK